MHWCHLKVALFYSLLLQKKGQVKMALPATAGRHFGVTFRWFLLSASFAGRCHLYMAPFLAPAVYRGSPIVGAVLSPDHFLLSAYRRAVAWIVAENPLSVNGCGRAGNSAIRGNSDCFGSAIPLSAELRTAMAGRQPVYGSVHGFWYPRKSVVGPHLYSHTYTLKKRNQKDSPTDHGKGRMERK